MKKTDFSTVGIVAKPHADHLQTILPKVVKILQSYGCKVLIDKESYAVVDGNLESLPRGEVVQLSDMVVVLGGDGTMLSLARHQSEIEKPVLGINMGSLGFLTEISIDEAPDMIEKALRGELERSYRMMLDSKLVRGGSVKSLQPVLNDVVISKTALARIFDVDIVINGKKISTIRADGIIVSTPTGSTAYNLAANGPIVHPEMDVILITPICPHTLTYRPVVLSGDSIIELNLKDSEETYLTLDGQTGFPLDKGDIVRITRSDLKVTLFNPANKNFFLVLHSKLKWGYR